MVKREVEISGKKVIFGASALLPKIYRIHFGKDLISDMNRLRKNYSRVKSLPDDDSKEDRNSAFLDEIDLTIFERVSWAMAYHADREGRVPEDPDEWLESIDGIFSIYEIFPVLLDLWGMNNRTTSVPAKK